MFLVGFNRPLLVQAPNTTSRREDRLGRGLYARCSISRRRPNAVIEIVGIEALLLEHAVDNECTFRIPGYPLLCPRDRNRQSQPWLGPDGEWRLTELERG